MREGERSGKGASSKDTAVGNRAHDGWDPQRKRVVHASAFVCPYWLGVTSASTKYPFPPAGPVPRLSRLLWVRESPSSLEKYSSYSGEWEGSLELSMVVDCQ